MSKQYRLADLTQGLPVTIQGNDQILISGIGTIEEAQSGQIAFLANPLYKRFLQTTQASAIILAPDEASDYTKGTAVITSNPYFIYAKIAAYFSNAVSSMQGIHPTAVIGADCRIDPTASIGPHCVIGDRVKIDNHAVVGPGTTIGSDSSLGANTHIDAKVSIYHQVRIGERCRIMAGAVIGSDGFGFANQSGAWHKVPQLGGVLIGDEVDVGANTTIDRGAVQDTVIGNGVKLDNLIQVGHNVKIGDHTIIAGCAAISGSTTIGKYCMIGGASCFAGHITIADKVIITGMTAVTKSIIEPGMYSSGIVGAVPNLEFRKNNARFHRLENLMQRVKHLETLLNNKSEVAS